MTAPDPSLPRPMVEVSGLVKRFGETVAVAGVDLTVHAGRIVGVLGPNGAGKTTTINCLTTLLRPDEGRVVVAGVDVVADPAGARRHLAVTGQDVSLDLQLTGTENLTMFGRLRGLDRNAARARTTELLERFSLGEAADQLARTYSGGMRRRLDLAASLLVEPDVLFLDEPTTGLDPRSRQELWDTIRDMKASGMAIVLTTQYLEEADVLADHIVVIDRGRTIAEGTADELKRRVGGTRCHVEAAEPDDAEALLAALDPASGAVLDPESRQVTLEAPNGPATVADVLARAAAAGIELGDVGLRRPSLDDVFLSLTGRTPAEEAAEDAAGLAR